ncbi:MAG: hypothetical protein ABSC93_32000 [Bryobacteraceae bacterium]|jgi:hypothetical protein
MRADAADRGALLFLIHCTRYQVERHAQFFHLGFESAISFAETPESFGSNVLAI